MCNNTHSPTRSNGPGANRLQAAQQEPQKTGNSTTVPLQEKEGSSFNLSNCCQAFISNSLVSETGSLVSRALSGDSPCPRLPRHLCWRDFSAPPSVPSSLLLFPKAALARQSISALWAQTQGCLCPKTALLCHGLLGLFALCFSRGGGDTVLLDH